LGRLLELPQFGPDADEDFRQLNKQLNASLAKDRKAQKEDAAEGKVSFLRGIAHGTAGTGRIHAYHDVMVDWMSKIRRDFAGHIIRRTGNSVNNEGHKISGLDPYHEHILLLDLLPHENDNLDNVTATLANSDETGSRRAAQGRASM
jgi:hypothetical protein